MSISPSTDATHVDPVWRERANFIIGADIVGTGRTEQFWVRQIEDKLFEICCIPFFLYDVALGDVVETDREHTIVRVAENSNRAVFRVWFGDSHYSKNEIEKGVRELGGLVEWSSGNLMAIDAAGDSTATALFGYLQDHHHKQHLIVEIGKWVHGRTA